MERFSLKREFKCQLSEPAKDKEGNIIRVKGIDGNMYIVTRGQAVVDKCISRAERGDMYAMKLIVDLVEPKELRLAVAAAVTVEHTLNPVLQQIVDKLSLDDKTVKLIEKPKKTVKSRGGSKNPARAPKISQT